MKHHHVQSHFAFRFMALGFCLRDWLRPPTRILQEAGLRSGMTVLDFGCGPGGFSMAAARLVGPKGQVHALDVHPLALKMVGRMARKKSLGNLHPIHGTDADGLLDRNVDFAIVYDVLHGVPDPASVLKKIDRVLKEDGILSVSDHHLKEASLTNMIAAGGMFRLVGRNRWTYQFERVGIRREPT